MNKLIVCALVFAAVMPGRAPASEGNLSAVLARMDAAGASFRSMTAKMNKVQHTAILNDDSKESGTIKLLKVKPGELRMLGEITEPDPKGYALRGNKAELYYPKIATVQEYNLSKHKGLVEQFLRLGFGSTGKELLQSYTIKLIGNETVNGQETGHLELVPKSAQAREIMKTVELWINAQGYPVRQKFLEPSGDYRLVDYTDVKINPGLTAEDVTLQLPKNVKREFPQK